MGAGGVFLPLGGMKPISVPWEGCNVPLMEPPHVVREGVGVGICSQHEPCAVLGLARGACGTKSDWGHGGISGNIIQ